MDSAFARVECPSCHKVLCEADDRSKVRIKCPRCKVTVDVDHGRRAWVSKAAPPKLVAATL